MLDGVVPEEIAHLDFVPDADDAKQTEKSEEPKSPKTCRMPIGYHPFTEEVLRCGRPATLLIKWLCPKNDSVSAYSCKECWVGYSSSSNSKSRLELTCMKHSLVFDAVADLVSINPI